jgi:hypothetical protein
LLNLYPFSETSVIIFNERKCPVYLMSIKKEVHHTETKLAVSPSEIKCLCAESKQFKVALKIFLFLHRLALKIFLFLHR